MIQLDRYYQKISDRLARMIQFRLYLNSGDRVKLRGEFLTSLETLSRSAGALYTKINNGNSSLYFSFDIK